MAVRGGASKRNKVPLAQHTAALSSVTSGFFPIEHPSRSGGAITTTNKKKVATKKKKKNIEKTELVQNLIEIAGYPQYEKPEKKVKKTIKKITKNENETRNLMSVASPNSTSHFSASDTKGQDKDEASECIDSPSSRQNFFIDELKINQAQFQAAYDEIGLSDEGDEDNGENILHNMMVVDSVRKNQYSKNIKKDMQKRCIKNKDQDDMLIEQSLIKINMNAAAVA